MDEGYLQKAPKGNREGTVIRFLAAFADPRAFFWKREENVPRLIRYFEGHYIKTRYSPIIRQNLASKSSNALLSAPLREKTGTTRFEIAFQAHRRIRSSAMFMPMPLP